MDWSKAKNVLIIAFIITNILLVYVIQRDLFDNEDLQLISNDYIKNVESYLLDNGLQIDTEIPREIISLPILMVKYKVFDLKEMAKIFLEEDYQMVDEDTYVSGDKKIQRISNKKFIYTNPCQKKGSYPLDEKEVIEISKEFLEKHNFMQQDLELQQIYFGVVDKFGSMPVYKLVYNQVYKNKFLAESYIHVYVQHQEVIGLEAMLLEYEKTQGQKKKTVPATEALLRKMNDILMDNQEDNKITISNLELGYYFNTTDINLTTWDTIASGTAFPSWKIVLDNGKTYYVEALKN